MPLCPLPVGRLSLQKIKGDEKKTWSKDVIDVSIFLEFLPNYEIVF
jgi:hypothetical protein